MWVHKMIASVENHKAFAHTDKAKSIHFSDQFEHHKNMVDDRSLKVGGRQCIVTNDGYVIPAS